MITHEKVIDDGFMKSVKIKFYYEGERPSFHDIDEAQKLVKTLLGNITQCFGVGDEYIFINNYTKLDPMDFITNHIPEENK